MKGYAWVWMERVTPKTPRVPNPAVLAVRVANLVEKDVLISTNPLSGSVARVPALVFQGASEGQWTPKCDWSP